MSITRFKPDIEHYEEMLNLSGQLLMTVNAELYVRYFSMNELGEYRKIFLTTCDSKAASLFSKLLSGRIIPVITGADAIQYFFKYKPNLKYLVIGASRASNDLALEKASTLYGCENILGLSPVVSDDGEINEDFEKMISDYKPDIVFVAFGAPKQEKFLIKHRKAINNHVKYFAMGVGAGVDFLSGAQIRSPVIFQKIGLEWLWRLFTRKGHYKRVLFSIKAFMK